MRTGRPVRGAAGWAAPACTPILSGAALVLVPKCPACVAAYVAGATGLGISISVASHFRTAIIVLLVLSLLVIARRVVRRLRRLRKAGSAR